MANEQLSIDELSERAYAALDRGDLEASKEILDQASEAYKKIEKPNAFEISALACILIDIGTAVSSESAIEKGQNLFEQNYEMISGEIEAASIEYNLGNAKKSLYALQASTAEFKFRPESIALLTESKNHYWRSLKLSGDRWRDPTQHVNLANSLNSCARVVEALRWYNSALQIRPGFGMAELNRGLALMFLNTISGNYSISLLDTASQCFSRAALDKTLPEPLAEQASNHRRSLETHLLALGWDDERIASYEAEHKKQFDEHDSYWNFCLDHYLALSEHALYCRCAGARRDDLSVMSSAAPIGGDFVPRLELLLNRLKSEFCLARALYYQVVAQDGEKWSLTQYEGTFSEFYESEAIGMRAEFLRTSFRLCFGILDRIAQGLNELYRFTSGTEVLYFESFWKPRKRGKAASDGRWETLNLQENMGLVALYSLATDLNRRGGEWGHFKEMRNELEHGVLVLLEDGASRLPPLLEPTRIRVSQQPFPQFEGKTLHMLQFVASAIFNFAFVVRAEGRRKLERSNQKKPRLRIETLKKHVGKT